MALTAGSTSAMRVAKASIRSSGVSSFFLRRVTASTPVIFQSSLLITPLRPFDHQLVLTPRAASNARHPPMKMLGRRTVAALGWTLLLPPSARADRPLVYDL